MDERLTSRAIFHIAVRERWEAAASDAGYRGDTLESEGFIHCSTPSQLIGVANRVFRGRSDLVLLQIDEQRVRADVRYEASDREERYPHIYGPLNLDAVVGVTQFTCGADGLFALPVELGE